MTLELADPENFLGDTGDFSREALVQELRLLQFPISFRPRMNEARADVFFSEFLDEQRSRQVGPLMMCSRSQGFEAFLGGHNLPFSVEGMQRFFARGLGYWLDRLRARCFSSEMNTLRGLQPNGPDGSIAHIEGVCSFVDDERWDISLDELEKKDGVQWVSFASSPEGADSSTLYDFAFRDFCPRCLSRMVHWETHGQWIGPEEAMETFRALATPFRALVPKRLAR